MRGRALTVSTWGGRLADTERRRARADCRGLRAPFRGRRGGDGGVVGGLTRNDCGMTKIHIRHHDVDITDVLRIHAGAPPGPGLARFADPIGR